MKDQTGVFSPKPTSPIDTFAAENDLDESQYTELKRSITGFIKPLKGFTEDTETAERSERKALK